MTLALLFGQQIIKLLIFLHEKLFCFNDAVVDERVVKTPFLAPRKDIKIIIIWYVV